MGGIFMISLLFVSVWFDGVLRDESSVQILDFCRVSAFCKIAVVRFESLPCYLKLILGGIKYDISISN